MRPAATAALVASAEGRMRSLLVLAALAVTIACGGGSDTPNSPSAPTPTRVISLRGPLQFGNVQVGQTACITLSITNTGNAMLTYSGLSFTGGTADVFSAAASGTILPGSVHLFGVFFKPVEARAYSGTLRVDADHTSGTNTIDLSGTGDRNAASEAAVCTHGLF